MEVKLLKTPRQWGSFGSWTVEEAGFSLTLSNSRGKMARSCGTKHISKSKYTVKRKNKACSEHFWKVHAAAVPSAFPNQNVNRTTCDPNVRVLQSRKQWHVWDV